MIQKPVMTISPKSYKKAELLAKEIAEQLANKELSYFEAITVLEIAMNKIGECKLTTLIGLNSNLSDGTETIR